MLEDPGVGVAYICLPNVVVFRFVEPDLAQHKKSDGRTQRRLRDVAGAKGPATSNAGIVKRLGWDSSTGRIQQESDRVTDSAS